MPIRQYFIWVGSALLVALFCADRWFPEPVTPAYAAISPGKKVNLRILSDQRWPERVVFDTTHSAMAFATGVAAELNVDSDEDRERTGLRNTREAFASMEANNKK